MKVQYLITSFEGGGGSFTLPEIIRAFQRNGCDVDVLALEPRDMRAYELLKENGINPSVLCRKKKSKSLYIIKLFRKLRHERPDVIVTSLAVAGFVGAIVGRLLGIRVISWINNENTKKFTKYILDIPSLWIADSESVGRFLSKELRISPEKIEVWPLYARKNFEPKKQFWDGRGPLVIGSLGRLSKQKNYAALIGAVKEFLKTHADVDLKVIIGGDGPLKKDLENQIRKNGLCRYVQLKGHVCNVSDFLKNIDIYVQPSLYEGMCIAVHEAFEVGLPVIATSVGQLKDCVVTGKTGFIVSKTTAEKDIAAALEKFVSRPELLREYGQAGRTHVLSHYGEERLNRVSDEIVQKIMKLVSADRQKSV